MKAYTTPELTLTLLSDEDILTASGVKTAKIGSPNSYNWDDFGIDL